MLSNKAVDNLNKAMVLAGATNIQTPKASSQVIVQSNSKICPKCRSIMVHAHIDNGREVLYCTRDRVCLPTQTN